MSSDEVPQGRSGFETAEIVIAVHTRVATLIKGLSFRVSDDAAVQAMTTALWNDIEASCPPPERSWSQPTFETRVQAVLAYVKAWRPSANWRRVYVKAGNLRDGFAGSVTITSGSESVTLKDVSGIITPGAPGTVQTPSPEPKTEPGVKVETKVEVSAVQRMKDLATASTDAALDGAAYRVVRNMVVDAVEPYRAFLPEWALAEQTVAAAIWFVAAMPIVGVPNELPAAMQPFGPLVKTCVALARRAAAGAAMTFGAEGADVAYALAKRGLALLNERLRGAGVGLDESGELRLLGLDELRDLRDVDRLSRLEAEVARLRGGAS